MRSRWALSQLVADYVTIDEFGRTMLEELDR